MRKILVLMLAIMMMCVSFPMAHAHSHDAHLTIVATTYPLYDMVMSIGGGHLNVIYAPEVSAESLNAADVLLCVGTPEEAWVSDLDDVAVVIASDGIELLENDWDVSTIPINNMLIATYLTEELCRNDYNHREVYLANLDSYINAMIQLDTSFRAAIEEGMKIACDDGSMAYFGKEYGVEIVSQEEDALVLHAYTYPAEGDLTVSYIQLMERNLAALIAAE